MKNQVDNRIEAEVMRWQAKEQRLANLFSRSVLQSRDFDKEKLAHFERILERRVAGLSQEERTTLRLLRREKVELERKLYPGLAFRLFRSLMKRFFQPAINGKKEIRMASQERDLQETIKKMGLHVPQSRIGKHLREGRASFDIPVSQYTMEHNRVDFELRFSLNEKGNYEMSQLRAQRQAEGKVLSQSVDTALYPDLSGKQVLNLLEGRAVRSGELWIQLDLNDRDQEGNHRIKHFSPAYGFDLENALSGWQLSEMRKEAPRQKLIEALAAGERVEVTLDRNGERKVVSLQVNPQFKSVDAIDERGQKFNISPSKENRPGKALKLEQKPGLKAKRVKRLSVA